MANEESEYERRAVERLVFFSDAVVAIAITLLAIDLPVPSGATAGAFWSSARAHDGVYLAFLVSFLTIAVAWSHHHDAFKYARRADSWLRNATMIWLLTIILIPSATKLLTGLRARRAHRARPALGVLRAAADGAGGGVVRDDAPHGRA